jgi:hypothetical protein
MEQSTTRSALCLMLYTFGGRWLPIHFLLLVLIARPLDMLLKIVARDPPSAPNPKGRQLPIAAPAANRCAADAQISGYFIGCQNIGQFLLIFHITALFRVLRRQLQASGASNSVYCRADERYSRALKPCTCAPIN